MSRELPRGLVVSCQALKEEPMYGGKCMSKMAYAAVLGGARGIRANTIKDIKMISKKVGVPIVGLIKHVYADSCVYITPTLKEVKALIKSSCDIIALDATDSKRSDGVCLESLIRYIHDNSDKKIMADIATIDEAITADKLKFDYVSSTLRGYTENTSGLAIPDINFLKLLYESLQFAKPIAEGGISDTATISEILSLGYETIIIGGAITRPMEITKRFVSAFNN